MDSYPHRNSKIMSLQDLIQCIEDLEVSNIISFEEFKQMPYYEIKKQFFAAPHPTLVRKAIIKILDKRAGKIGPSIYETERISMKNGKITSLIKREYF